jgi:hypothetical protein
MVLTNVVWSLVKCPVSRQTTLEFGKIEPFIEMVKS